MRLISKKGIKEELKKFKIKIGNNSLNILIKIKENEIKQSLNVLIRNVRISGRKTIKPQDIIGD